LEFILINEAELRICHFCSAQINIDKFSANMEGAVVQLLGIERGNATTLSGPVDDTALETNRVRVVAALICLVK